MIISGTSFFTCLASSDFFEGSLSSCITLVDCVNCQKKLLGLQSRKLVQISFLKTCGYANYSASTNNVFYVFRGGFRVATASKTECFVIIVNGFHPLTIIIKHSILDVAATLDPPLVLIFVFQLAVLGKELLTRIKLISVN